MDELCENDVIFKNRFWRQKKKKGWEKKGNCGN